MESFYFVVSKTVVGVSDRGVLNQPVNLFYVLPIPDGDAKRYKVYTGSSNRCSTSSLRDRFLYSLHRSACSRGLQAKGERELVPGLGRVSCGPLEALLSGGRDVRVCVCYQVFSPL